MTVTRGVSTGSPNLTISWTAVTSNELEVTYTLWYINNSASDYNAPPSSANSYNTGNNNSITLIGLGQNESYSFWVAAASSDGQGSYSSTASQTTFAGLLCFLCLNPKYIYTYVHV